MSYLLNADEAEQRCIEHGDNVPFKELEKLGVWIGGMIKFPLPWVDRLLQKRGER